jgi:tetratricopeptide (TPR) repeat protein
MWFLLHPSLILAVNEIVKEGVITMERRGASRDNRGRPGKDSPRPERRDSRGENQGPKKRSKQNSKRNKPEEPRRVEPEIPEEIYREALDPQLLREMSSLSTDNAEQTARHLLALVHFLPDNPERAHAHGIAASARAARIGRVRELAGIAAYNAGKFDISLRELKTAYRITGDPSLWPMIADSHRGIGEPLKAIEMSKGPEMEKLDKDGLIEMRIVLSGARRDLGENQAALTVLECKELREENPIWSARLRYAYADTLAALGQRDKARDWFIKAAAVDIDQETDAQERVSQIQ